MVTQKRSAMSEPDIGLKTRVSIVIPTLNEAARIPGLLASLRTQDPAIEIIVVDGGSGDETVAAAEAAGARVLTTRAGRGRQLAAGAAAACGDVLWFVHADSQVPPGALDALRDALDADPVLTGGNFRLLFDGDDPFSRWLDGFYAWIRTHGFYYGDSAIFVRRQIYDALGGIQPIALMEDYDFIRRIERQGRTCCIDSPPLVTSSRRFSGRRPAGIVFGWLAIHALFHLGVPPRWLARLYNSTRRPGFRRVADQDFPATPLSDQS
jgi:rSAM/selenodomain-associated transferase 2